MHTRVPGYPGSRISAHRLPTSFQESELRWMGRRRRRWLSWAGPGCNNMHAPGDWSDQHAFWLRSLCPHVISGAAGVRSRSGLRRPRGYRWGPAACRASGWTPVCTCAQPSDQWSPPREIKRLSLVGSSAQRCGNLQTPPFYERPCAQHGTPAGLFEWDLPVGRGRVRIRDTTVNMHRAR